MVHILAAGLRLERRRDMILDIGDVIGEFRQNEEPEGGYTNRLKYLYLVKGRLPDDGDWQIVCIQDSGFEERIPETQLETGEASGRYAIGGYDIVMRAAKMIPPALDLLECRREEEDE